MNDRPLCSVIRQNAAEYLGCPLRPLVVDELFPVIDIHSL